jgi:pimeloyl-ACP methyl ester carboxylesterase
MTSSIRPDTTHHLRVVSGHLVVKVAIHEWRVERPVATAFCLHGFAGNAMDFAVLAKALAQRGVATVAIDMPGRGASDFLGDASLYSMRLQQLVLFEALALVKGPFIMVGTSWGGVIAGLMAPHLKRQPVALVLNDTPVRSLLNLSYPHQDFLKDEALLNFRTLSSAQIYLTSTRMLHHLPVDQLNDLTSASIMRVGDVFRMRYDPALADRIGRTSHFDMIDALAASKIPTLALLGEYSHLATNEDQKHARAKLHDLSEHICSKEAHPPSLSQTADIDHILDFTIRCLASDALD